jgi:hypothetical protein
LILVSSDQITLFQSSTVQSRCLIAKSILAFLCFFERNGLFLFITAFIPAFLKLHLTVSDERGWLIMGLRVLATWDALSSFPLSMRCRVWQISAGESLGGQPPEDLGMLGQCLEHILNMTAREILREDEIW